MNEYQESYEKEISLTELLFFCLKKWRWIAAVMVIAAVLAGAYKYQAVVKSNQQKLAAEETDQEESDPEEEAVIANPNVEYYNRAIESTQQELDTRKEYMDSSVIMQLDPYRLDTASISFYINAGDADETVKRSLLSAYISFVEDGKLAAQLAQTDDSIPEEELQYLLKAESEAAPVIEETFKTDAEGTASASSIEISGPVYSTPGIIRIRISADSQERCEAYGETVKNALKDYSLQLQQIGEHELQVLDQSQSRRISQELLEYQEGVLNSYTSAFEQLKKLESERDTILEEEGATISVGQTVIYESPGKEAVKFAVIGLVLGAFLTAFALVVIYLMSGRLQSTEAFKEEFGMPLLGQITRQNRKKALFGFVDRWILRLEEGGYADITYEEQVKIAAANLKTAAAKEQGMKKIMFAGTIAKEEAEKFGAVLSAELGELSLSPYQRIVFQASALEALDGCDGIFFLEKKGMSDVKLIKKEKELAVSREVKVLGAIVL